MSEPEIVVVGESDRDGGLICVISSLTGEQIAAISKLIAWYRYWNAEEIGEWKPEWDELPALFGG